MNWLRQYWEVPALLAVLIAIAAAFIFMIAPRSAIQMDHHELRERRRDGCVQVLKCLDLGVDREQCDALFPACSQTEGD